MSSSRLSDWVPARWSLRTRLLVTLVAVVVGVCAAIGVGTTVAVYHVQIGQLDEQLGAAVGRAQHPGRPEPNDHDADNGAATAPRPPGQDLNTISTRADEP